MTRRSQRTSLTLMALEPRMLFSGTVVIAAPAIDCAVELHASTSAVQVGEVVTFTATVTPAAGPSINGLWVQLWDNGTVFVTSAQLTNDSATLTWSPRGGGLHTISAEFPAQDGYSRSISSNVGLNVFRRAAAVDLQVQAAGNKVRLIVAVSSADPLSLAPTGTVQLFDGAHFVGKVSAGASTSLSLTVPAGVHFLSAFYSGDSAFFPAQVSKNLVIETAPAAVGGAGTFVAVDSGSRQRVSATISVVSGTGKSLPVISEAKSGSALADSRTLPPEFKQFYEFHVPPPLTAEAAQALASLQQHAAETP